MLRAFPVVWWLIKRLFLKILLYPVLRNQCWFFDTHVLYLSSSRNQYLIQYGTASIPFHFPSVLWGLAPGEACTVSHLQ
jgi:hypothetical protein